MVAPSTRPIVVGGHGAASVAQLVSGLPLDRGLALLVVVPGEPNLVEHLRPLTKLPVSMAEHEHTLEPERIYVVPHGRDVVIRRGRFQITPASIPGVQLDRLVRSIADEAGRASTVVILEGHGTDGVLGAKRLKEAGGLVLAGPLAEGPTGEMARAAMAHGLVDQVAPIDQLATLLGRLNTDSVPSEDDGRDDQTDALRDILAFVRIRSGHDFSAYKRATLSRRIARRIQVCQVDSISGYHRYLRDHPVELSHLLRDFLISVTNFFRDSEAYEALATEILPRLLHERTDPIRVWVAGCATGEEAYSLGMLLLEQCDKQRTAPRIQIFATDIDEDALTEARAGLYPETIAVDVSPERLQRFFVREAECYRVSQALRETILFSPHNVLRDPPFSRLDLVSCRNLMIYLNRDAQSRVLSMFHFGLRPDCFLFLGSSESAENTSLFSPVDPKHRIFARRLGTNVHGLQTIASPDRWHAPPPSSAPTAPSERAGSIGEIHHRLAERHAPPSILVNSDLDIVHVSEHAGAFLTMSPGEPTRQVLRSVLPALRLDLRAAIYAARQDRAITDARRVSFDDNGKHRGVELRVRAVQDPELGQQGVLVYFDEVEGDLGPTTRPSNGDPYMEPVVREIEDELRRTRDQLRNTVEQYETSVEELKASNEELQAINEELRSASEELETSKEELQSVNEELTTLNHELKAKIDEVSSANGDLQNLMKSTDIGVVFLDRTLNVKRFTPRARDLFNIIPSDVGRPIAHVTHKLETEELPDLARSVLQHLRTVERDVVSRDGRRYLLRLLPYRSLEDRIEGVVLTFVDVSDLREAVDARRRTEAALEASEARLRLSLRGAPLVVFDIDTKLQVTWGYARGEELSPGPLSIITAAHTETLQQRVEEVLADGVGRRVELDFEIRGETRTYDVQIERTTGMEVTAVGFDVTSNKEARAILVETDRRKDEFLATLSHELRNPLTPLKVGLDVAQMSVNDPVKLASAHGIMARQLGAITALVDELLDLSRITQGKIELAKESVEPIAIVEAALETTRPLLADSKHELSVDVPRTTARILGDPIRLVQILVNLITNAAKYTPPGGRIELAAKLDGSRQVAIFVVRDNGVGIAPELLPRIFEIFFQSRDQLGRSRGGLGIGLALVKRLVELHGGSVTAHSDGQHGSEFAFELPVIN